MMTGIPLLILIFLIIVFVIILCGPLKIHPFISIMVASVMLGISAGLPLMDTVDAIQSGFGGLMKYIGLVVVFGSIIGVFLEKSGGAMRIAQTILSLVGKNNSISAMSLIGAIISIPVFCDSGFILLSGLTDRLSKLSKENKPAMTLALATGLYTTHTLVPPTPGPIAAAGNLGASEFLGTIILLGICISIPILIFTQIISKRLGPKLNVSDQEELIPPTTIAIEQENIDLPSLTRSILPLAIPILLIGVGTLLPFLGFDTSLIRFIGNPLIAIFIGALLAIILLRPIEKGGWETYLKSALIVAGPILIITGAGGAFGGVLKATPLSETVGQWLGTGVGSEISALLIVFAIAAVLKTAQGSSTSAMVITSSILAPLIPVLGWSSPMDFAIAVMAIGAGAMTISHYNDSYFWVVSQFGGLSHDRTYRSFSLMTGLMGVSILLICILLSMIF